MFPFLVYVSSAVAPMDTNALYQLLAQSRAKNERLGITGALLYQGGQFIQVLEGSLESIEDVFETICGDPRHHHIYRLVDGWNTTQQFPDWSMAFDDLTGHTSSLAISLQSLLHAPADDNNRLLAGAVLNTFRAQLTITTAMTTAHLPQRET